MSGMTEQFVLARADFAELLGRHRERIAAADSLAVPFSADDPLTDLRAFRAARVDRLVALGIAKFLDEQHRWYKYTVKGAFVAAVRAAGREWVRSFRDRHRNQIKRPGDASYVPSGGRTRGGLACSNSLRSLCWILVFIGVGLSFGNRVARRPANSAQLLFRVVVPAVGLAGLVLLWIHGLVLRRSTRADEE
jgi:hypothetical protein